jgi:hypothetical protein
MLNVSNITSTGWIITSGVVIATWQVLTRRHQLAMKEEKQRKRKQAEEEKKATKEKTCEPEKKPKRRVKDKKEQTGKDNAEKEVEETDAVKAEKPRRRLKQMKTTDCLPEDFGEQPEPEEVPEVPAAPKPKPASKAKSSAKAKAKSQAKAKTEPKRKAAAKKVEKVETPENGSNGLDSDEDPAVATPKKELFQSEEESSNGDQDDQAPDHHVDPKPSKAKRLQKALESCVPDAHRASKRQRAKPAVALRASGASLEDEAEEPVVAKNPRKRKSKSKGKQSPSSKAPLSPFAKKEVKRRKQKEDAVMKSAACEDKQIQAVILQHMKNVEDLTEEGAVKSHLMSCLKDKDLNKEFRLNEYWKRPAIGVKVMSLGDGSVKNAPEVAYFGRSCIGACPSQWNLELTVLYASASLMVFRLNYVHTALFYMITTALLPKEFGSFQMNPKIPYTTKGQLKKACQQDCSTWSMNDIHSLVFSS